MLILVAFLFGAALAAFRTTWDSPVDFDLFWMVGRHPSHAYDPDFMRGGYATEFWWPETLRHVLLPFAYPPTSMLLWLPLSGLPAGVAFILYSGGTSAIFMAFCVRRAGWLAALALFSLPLAYGALLGQPGLLISCAAIAAFELIESRPRLAGVIFAAMVCIKPQAAIVAPFVLWGRWEAVKAGVVTGVAMVLGSLLFGPHRWIEWVQAIGPFRGEVEAVLPKIMPYLLFGGLIWWRILLIGVGLLFATWERGLTGFLVGSLLCSPYFQLYDLAGFSFLGLLIVSDWKRVGALNGLAAGMFGVVLIACPTYIETISIFCLVLIALRVFANRIAVGRVIEFSTPRVFQAFRLASHAGHIR